MKSPENATKRIGIESLYWLARSAVFVIGTICFSAILEDRLLLALDQRLYPIQAISSVQALQVRNFFLWFIILAFEYYFYHLSE